MSLPEQETLPQESAISIEWLEKQLEAPYEDPNDIIRLYEVDEQTYKILLANLGDQIESYLQGKQIALVVGILNSGEDPANFLATKFDAPTTFVEYHNEQLEKDGEIREDAMAENPYGATPPALDGYGTIIHKSLEVDKENILDGVEEDEQPIILVVDDATSTGRNAATALKQVKEQFPEAKVIYASVGASVLFPGKGLGYDETFCCYYSDTYGYF